MQSLQQWGLLTERIDKDLRGLRGDIVVCQKPRQEVECRLLPDACSFFTQWQERPEHPLHV